MKHDYTYTATYQHNRQLLTRNPGNNGYHWNRLLHMHDYLCTCTCVSTAIYIKHTHAHDIASIVRHLINNNGFPNLKTLGVNSLYFLCISQLIFYSIYHFILQHLFGIGRNWAHEPTACRKKRQRNRLREVHIK